MRQVNFMCYRRSDRALCTHIQTRCFPIQTLCLLMIHLYRLLFTQLAAGRKTCKQYVELHATNCGPMPQCVPLRYITSAELTVLRTRRPRNHMFVAAWPPVWQHMVRRRFGHMFLGMACGLPHTQTTYIYIYIYGTRHAALSLRATAGSRLLRAIARTQEDIAARPQKNLNTCSLKPHADAKCICGDSHRQHDTARDMQH